MGSFPLVSVDLAITPAQNTVEMCEEACIWVAVQATGHANFPQQASGELTEGDVDAVIVIDNS